jgi:hypothetical protein
VVKRKEPSESQALESPPKASGRMKSAFLAAFGAVACVALIIAFSPSRQGANFRIYVIPNEKKPILVRAQRVEHIFVAYHRCVSGSLFSLVLVFVRSTNFLAAAVELEGCVPCENGPECQAGCLKKAISSPALNKNTQKLSLAATLKRIQHSRGRRAVHAQFHHQVPNSPLCL